MILSHSLAIFIVHPERKPLSVFLARFSMTGPLEQESFDYDYGVFWITGFDILSNLRRFTIWLLSLLRSRWFHFGSQINSLSSVSCDG
jgi:hypothetical protein